MRRLAYYIRLVGAGCITMLLLASCHKKKESGEESTPEINVAIVGTDSIVLHQDYPGYLEARQKANVVGEVSGRLLTKNFTAGQYVTKGQVLYTIESTKYRDAVEEAKAQLSTASGQRDYYAQQSKAMETAYEADAVSKMELLQSETSLKSYEASIRNASAALENARTMLDKCTVRAPISGYITDSEISVGNYVNGEASPQVLATIYDNSVFDAKFSIEDERFRTLLGGDGTGNAPLYRNMPLKFQQTLPHSYSADLYYVSPSVNSSTGSLELIGRVQNSNNELKDGMYVTVSLPYGTDARAVVVKDAALSTDQLGKYLYVVNDSNKVVYTPVTVGPLYHDSLRVIEKGVKPGQKYVTQALLTVRNGMTVKPKVVK